jgi:hypothetical protein
LAAKLKNCQQHAPRVLCPFLIAFERRPPLPDSMLSAATLPWTLRTMLDSRP